jgi:hypothetical protein
MHTVDIISIGRVSFPRVIFVESDLITDLDLALRSSHSFKAFDTSSCPHFCSIVYYGYINVVVVVVML